MAISHRYHTDPASLALELTMRDALEGLEELASADAFWFDPGCVEILGIEPPLPETPSNVTPFKRVAPAATILDFPQRSTQLRRGAR